MKRPDPRKLKIVRGNPGKQKLRPEPVGRPGFPRCPSHIKGIARREYNRLAGELYKERLLTRKERTALEMYATAYARYRKAQGKVEEQGEVVDGPQGTKKNPWLTAFDNAWEQMRRMLLELGCTPSARTRVTPVTEEEKSLEDQLKEQIAKKKAQ